MNTRIAAIVVNLCSFAIFAGSACAAGGISVQQAADGSVELSNLAGADGGNAPNAPATPQEGGTADTQSNAAAPAEAVQNAPQSDADASQTQGDANPSVADAASSTADPAATPDVNPREFLRNARDAQWANRLSLIRAGMAAAAQKQPASGGR
jgi:hypothetical protein